MNLRKIRKKGIEDVLTKSSGISYVRLKNVESHMGLRDPWLSMFVWNILNSCLFSQNHKKDPDCYILVLPFTWHLLIFKQLLLSENISSLHSQHPKKGFLFIFPPLQYNFTLLLYQIGEISCTFYNFLKRKRIILLWSNNKNIKSIIPWARKNYQKLSS